RPLPFIFPMDQSLLGQGSLSLDLTGLLKQMREGDLPSTTTLPLFQTLPKTRSGCTQQIRKPPVAGFLLQSFRKSSTGLLRKAAALHQGLIEQLQFLLLLDHLTQRRTPLLCVKQFRCASESHCPNQGLVTCVGLRQQGREFTLVLLVRGESFRKFTMPSTQSGDRCHSVSFSKQAIGGVVDLDDACPKSMKSCRCRRRFRPHDQTVTLGSQGLENFLRRKLLNLLLNQLTLDGADLKEDSSNLVANLSQLLLPRQVARHSASG